MLSIQSIAKTEQKAKQAAELLWQLLKEKRQIAQNTDTLTSIANQPERPEAVLQANYFLQQQDRLMELHNDLVNLIILFREGAPYKTHADLQHRISEFSGMHAAVRNTYRTFLEQNQTKPYQAA